MKNCSEKCSWKRLRIKWEASSVNIVSGPITIGVSRWGYPILWYSAAIISSAQTEQNILWKRGRGWCTGEDSEWEIDNMRRRNTEYTGNLCELELPRKFAFQGADILWLYQNAAIVFLSVACIFPTSVCLISAFTSEIDSPQSSRFSNLLSSASVSMW